jgi:hypothetical protein
MNLFGLSIDTTSHVVWFAGASLLVVGILGLNSIQSAVSGRWSGLLARAQERRPS